jgi:hypothetical protein
MDLKKSLTQLDLTRIAIGAIPVEVTLNKNPLGLFDRKYTIRFLTPSNESFTIGPKTLDEIVTYLKDRSLIYIATKATEVLSIIITAFERNGQLIVKNDVDTSGFYFIEGDIRQYTNNNNIHPKPTSEQIITCCELIDDLQKRFKKKDIFPTLLKWSIVAPFNFVLKQHHKKWIPWLYPYGWSNTGKSTLGDISCCIWNRYDDKDSIVSFTAADTKARFGEVLSKTTYPIVINEVAQLSDDKYKDLLEMFKTAITDIVARKKFVNKTAYTDILSLSPCILTGNSTPPTDTGFRRRIIPIVFTQNDQYSEDEIKVFKNLFEIQIKKELKILGDFTVNYLMENKEILTEDKNMDWKDIGEHILEQLFKSAGKESPPEWIKFFVEEYQLQEIKEDIELLFRNYLVNKVNETFSRHYRAIEKANITNKEYSGEVTHLLFSERLAFCLRHNLIPFLNFKVIDGSEIIIITSDLINDIKNKIPSISSLNEVAQLIEGFEYGQKKITNKRNVRAAYGPKNYLLDFIGVNY